jgi:hypothetical protein
MDLIRQSRSVFSDHTEVYVKGRRTRIWKKYGKERELVLLYDIDQSKIFLTLLEN